MAKFLMLGKYSLEGVKGISSERTKKAIEIIKGAGGKADTLYALLGAYELAFFVDFPGTSEAMKASVLLTKSTSISFSTFPAIEVEEFDRLIAQ
jgi:uncharacterized protein with GYD domain